MSVKQSQRDGVHMSDDVKHSDGKRLHAWVVPARFSPLGYSNDLCYLGGDNTI